LDPSAFKHNLPCRCRTDAAKGAYHEAKVSIKSTVHKGKKKAESTANEARAQGEDIVEGAKSALDVGRERIRQATAESAPEASLHKHTNGHQ
jgi:hypothetical protein